MSDFSKVYGSGVGLRPTHYSQFLEQPPKSVSWIEVISENFMPWKNLTLGRSFQKLEKFRKDFPISLHGVSLNIGSTDPVDLDYLRRLKILIDAINPFVVSDHLSWTGVGGFNMHDLLPLPYTQESLTLISEKIDYVQNYLGRRILVENPSSYFEFKESEMSENEFIIELLNRSDCGLLLDINNVYVSSVNHQFNPHTYLSSLPSERIGQIHLAGHSTVDDHLIDTHDTAICDDVWALYKFSVEQFGIKNSMIERDGNIPDWNELEIEIYKMKEIQNGLSSTI